MFGQPLNYTEIYCFKLNFSSPFLAKLLCVDRFILHVTAGVGKVQPASLIRPAETLCPPRGVALKHGLLIDFVKNVDLIYFIYSTCIRILSENEARRAQHNQHGLQTKKNCPLLR